MKKLTAILFLAITLILGRQETVYSQHKAYSRAVVDTLCSPYFYGRGYVKNGMERAAQYIAAVFKENGLKPLSGQSYFQAFSYPVNTFPGMVKVSIDGQELVAGRDYLVGPESRANKGSFTLGQRDSNIYVAQAKVPVVIEQVKKLIWSPAPEVAEYTLIQLLDTAGNKHPQTVQLNIEQAFIPEFKTANVCAMIKGTQYPDSFLVVTAHYDHLGGMGSQVYFPGANDNASGVALLLNLAQYYARNPQKYTMVFIAFAGEEIGLKGSKYFTEHPLMPLSRIKFLINTDLAGTGVEGITVVNATEFPKAFTQLQEINTKQKLFTAVHSRGKAANSDHYFFTEKGVPAFFIYTQGGIAAYHDIYDQAHTLPLDHQEQLFELIVQFFKGL
ncbi:Aminopeptidase YwaD precursor [compost metagenome]